MEQDWVVAVGIFVTPYWKALQIQTTLGFFFVFQIKIKSFDKIFGKDVKQQVLIRVAGKCVHGAILQHL